MDLNHGMLFAKPTKIWATYYADCAGAVIIVLAVGAAQRPGETRMDLLMRNAALFQEIVPQVIQSDPDAILIVVTNPVDVLIHVTGQISDLPASRVIGSGTVLYCR